MCGIAGFISSRPVSGSVLKPMMDIIHYRGPDDEGYALFSDFTSDPVLAPDNEQGIIGLAHRRLSIVDLSSLGHQPMPYQDGRYWMTYNGEIYNYLELRQELETLGHSFKSQSDSEVILAAYAQWGADCLHKFNGMWSFAIIDRQAQTVFLARDRFGVKPLYYWVSPEGVLYFGSEIKQFTVLPGWAARVNAQRAYDFLLWGLCDHTQETMFQDVLQVRPGYYLLVKPQDIPASVNPVQWYVLKPRPFSGSFDEASLQFRALLDDAVKLRLRADVPVGSCLSGGLDSSSIVCLMGRQLDGKGHQKTFSAVSDVEQYNEKKWMDQVTSCTHVEDHYTHPSFDGLFDVSEKLTWHQDEPFGSTSIYAQWNVFELARKNNVIVMLDGQGADEQLAGYRNFFAPLLYGLFKSGRWITLSKEMKALKRVHGYSFRRSFENILNSMLPEPLQNAAKRLAGRAHKNPEWLDRKRLGAASVDPHRNLGWYADSVTKLCQSQLTSSNLQALLHWEDRDSMAHSLESRVPFLDYRLVEFSMGLPDDFKIKDGVTKRVLRHAMDGVLPNAIRDRMDKLGFATPEEIWVREKGTDLFRQKLREAVETSHGIIRPDILSYFEDILARRKIFDFTLWRVINFAQWVKIFNVQLS